MTGWILLGELHESNVSSWNVMLTVEVLDYGMKRRLSNGYIVYDVGSMRLCSKVGLEFPLIYRIRRLSKLTGGKKRIILMETIFLNVTKRFYRKWESKRLVIEFEFLWPSDS
jgi:hypothetical protein